MSRRARQFHLALLPCLLVLSVRALWMDYISGFWSTGILLSWNGSIDNRMRFKMPQAMSLTIDTARRTISGIDRTLIRVKAALKPLIPAVV